ncbi:hypothetical protein TanjilG_00101 [Lupinus angustifolius]|uniref:Uncharacterized protein n=1 Tax=Lupinus angustifolius TaxID=3871 RepID=A0A1J7H1J5_LUPAN|nr:hypothetical protein TanjilG_00101 [Lupinus angustifolius]
MSMFPPVEIEKDKDVGGGHIQIQIQGVSQGVELMEECLLHWLPIRGLQYMDKGLYTFGSVWEWSNGLDCAPRICGGTGVKIDSRSFKT